ncbi:MAG: CdaR family protein [Dehalococcoidia bacterium]
MRSDLREAWDIANLLFRRAVVGLRRSPGLLVLSLVLGFALWIAVTDIQNPTRVDVFPAAIQVEAVNVDPTLAVANTLETIEVTVSASEDRWQQLTSENFRAFVDLNGLSEREQLVPVQVDVRSIGGVRITNISPANVLVNLEPLVTKTVPVNPRLIGGVPLGFEVQSTEPDQTSAVVSGPASLVALVQEVAAEVTVTGLTVSLAETATLVPRGDNGVEIRGVRVEPPSTRVRVTVAQSQLTRQLPLHATFTGQPADGYRVASVAVDPASVTIDGPIDVLQSIDAIDLPAIDVTGATQSVTRTIEVELPAGATSPVSLSATVTILIEVIEGTAQFAVPVTVTGLPAGVEAGLDAAAVVVQIAGPIPTLNLVTAESILVTLDASGIEGTESRPVDVQVPAGVRLLAVQPESVSVTITPAP